MAFPYDFSVTQGGTLYGKYLIQAFGFGTAENPNGILIFDLDARKTVCRIDLSHSVLRQKNWKIVRSGGTLWFATQETAVSMSFVVTLIC